jgi:hypothetical protein
MITHYKIEYEKGLHKLLRIRIYKKSDYAIANIHFEYRWFKYAHLIEFLFLK